MVGWLLSSRCPLQGLSPTPVFSARCALLQPAILYLSYFVVACILSFNVNHKLTYRWLTILPYESQSHQKPIEQKNGHRLNWNNQLSLAISLSLPSSRLPCQADHARLAFTFSIVSSGYQFDPSFSRACELEWIDPTCTHFRSHGVVPTSAFARRAILIGFEILLHPC